jgi:general nucleoside transport system permease protein
VAVLRKESLTGWGQFALALAVTAGVGGGLILLAGADPLLAYARLFEGAFGARYEFGETIVRAVPLAIIALGVAPALRAGVFSIGSEGQLAIGALTATAAVLAVAPAPMAVLLPVGMIAGAIGGVLWALLPALMRAYANVNEILSTLLMNYLAGYLLLWLLKYHLAIPESVATPRSSPYPDAAMIPNLLNGSRLHWGIVFALLGAGALALWIRSVRGIATDIFATHPALAARMGLSETAAVMSTMLTAGAAAGLAGWVQVAALQGTLYPSVAGGVGFTGVLVALLGNLRPIGILLASLFFGALQSGAEGMQAGTNVPSAIAYVFEGMILLAATLILAMRHRQLRRVIAEDTIDPKA